MKIEGKDLEFWFNGIEIPTISIGLSEAFDSLDSTDSATPGDGKDFEVGRATRSFSVETNLYEPEGAEINTGTLTVGRRYRVTAKDTALAAYTIGQIFEATSALTMSATDKVVPLGDKLTGKTLGFTLGGAAVPLTAVDISIKFDSIDVTDTSTTGDGTETIVSRAERASKLSAILKSDDVDLLSTNPTSEAAVLTLASGQTVTGNVIPISKEIADEATGYAKVDYSFKWKGAPTEVNTGLICGVEHTFKLILKRGVTTNKEYTGNAIITEKTISSEVKGLTKTSYSVSINGVLTRAVAN